MHLSLGNSSGNIWVMVITEWLKQKLLVIFLGQYSLEQYVPLHDLILIPPVPFYQRIWRTASYPYLVAIPRTRTNSKGAELSTCASISERIQPSYKQEWTGFVWVSSLHRRLCLCHLLPRLESITNLSQIKKKQLSYKILWAIINTWKIIKIHIKVHNSQKNKSNKHNRSASYSRIIFVCWLCDHKNYITLLYDVVFITRNKNMEILIRSQRLNVPTAVFVANDDIVEGTWTNSDR